MNKVPYTPELVSVVIPAYNAAWCIRRAVECALSQTYSKMEVLVVDDGSTDATPAVLAEYGEAITVLCQPNGGLSSARNLGIRRAQGEFVAFLDADDAWLPEKVGRQVSLMRENPAVGFCSTVARLESPDGVFLGEWVCPVVEHSILHTLFTCNATVAGSGSSVMARRALFDQVGLFDESLKSLEDIDMWMRLAAAADYACIGEPLSVIMKRSDSMSGNLDVMRESALRVMKKNRHLLDVSLQRGFWQAAYAGVLADFAKWEYRSGRRWSAMCHVAEGLVRAPLRHGRLMLGLLLAMSLRRSL